MFMEALCFYVLCAFIDIKHIRTDNVERVCGDLKAVESNLIPQLKLLVMCGVVRSSRILKSGQNTQRVVSANWGCKFGGLSCTAGN